MTKTKEKIEYAGNRELFLIKRRVAKLGGWWNSEKYDKEGSDWQTFQFIHADKTIDVLLGLNGRFIIRDGDKMVTEESVEYDDVPWYLALLDLLYIRRSEAA